MVWHFTFNEDERGFDSHLGYYLVKYIFGLQVLCPLLYNILQEVIILQSKIYNFTKEELIAIISSSNTITEALNKVGLSPRGANYKTLTKRCDEEGIDLTSLRERITEYYKSRLRPSLTNLDDVLVENSTYSPGTLKRRLIKEGKLDNVCAECGIGPFWNHKDITLIMDHINGIPNDQRLENLRILCPNCHSQTPTYTGRNALQITAKTVHCRNCDVAISKRTKNQLCPTCWQKTQRKVERPTREELTILIQHTSIVQIGKRFGVSDRAIRKWLKAYEIPRP